MRVTDNDELIITIDNSTKLLKKEQIYKLVKNSVDPIVENVRTKLLDRSTLGLRKYNTTIWDNNSDNYLKHLQEELLDGANYCEKMMIMGVFSRDVIKIIEDTPNDSDLGKKIRDRYEILKNKNI